MCCLNALAKALKQNYHLTVTLMKIPRVKELVHPKIKKFSY